MTNAEYYADPSWSYSSLKLIIESGIDYAVGVKEGVFSRTYGSAVDLGEYIHCLVLGGENNFHISPYSDFRTKEARNWRNEIIDAGGVVISAEDAEVAKKIAALVVSHPNVDTLLVGDNVKHEVELRAKTGEGIKLKGKADAIHYGADGKPDQMCDLKTTAQFDKFFKDAQWKHYDLQAALYSMLAGIGELNYYFVVAETVEPYRVQVMHATPEFIEAGERKLRRCIDEVVKFNKRESQEPNFQLLDIKELGDYSL